MHEHDTRGLRRFHKVTIIAGAAFCGLLAWRFLEHYRYAHFTKDLVYAVVAALACVGLLAYLWRFGKSGI
jgi:hypothetical protein